MTPRVAIDIDGAVPVYEQIRSQLAGAIADGQLKVGDRLPSVRALAADLGIAVNTVARAYTELDAAGLIASRRRTGTTVIAGPSTRNAAPAIAAAANLARAARAAGLTVDQAVDLVRSAMLAP